MVRLATLLLLASVTSVSAETVESVEKTLIGNFQKYNSLSAKLNMKMTMGPGMSGTSTGTMEFLRHDGKEKVRSEMKMKMEFGEQVMESNVLNIFDGEHAYSVSDMMGQKRVMRNNSDQVVGRPGGTMFFEDLRKKNKLKLLPDAKVEGAPAYVIEATPKEPQPRGPARSMYYFDKAKGLLVKMEGINASDEAMLTILLSDMKLNPKLDPERFKYVPEPGVEVIDMTRD